MARLSQEKIIELIKKPRNAEELRQAVAQEERLVLHCEPIQERSLLPQQALKSFLAWVGSFLPKDKLLRFEQLLTLPADTTDLTETIFSELSKFLEAQDKVNDFSFVSDNLREDFDLYFAELNNSNYWKSKGLSMLKTGINSYIVVDLPTEQTTQRPEPYYYRVSVKDVVDVVINEKEDRLEYFIYRISPTKIVALDDEFYRVFERKENATEWTILLENPHSFYTESGKLIEGLGYCPAKDFYGLSIKGSKNINKKGPLTNVLGKLDYHLYWHTSKKYLESYGAWPITVTRKATCTYKDTNGHQCENGYVAYEVEGQADNSVGKLNYKKCPECESRSMIGPGSYWEVSTPVLKDQFDVMENPVKFVEMSNDKLEYVVQELERQGNEIYVNCVGYDGETMNKQAINENQVASNLESREAVLDTITEQFERIDKWVIETCCKIRYGKYFVSSTVFYGRQRFLKSPEDLSNELKLAKDAGLPSYYIAIIRKQIVQTRFKNDPQQISRDAILSELEPYPDYTIQQLQSMQIQTFDQTGFIVKINFANFIARFERENMNILTFGSLTSFKEKINSISQKLNEYAREQQQRLEQSQQKDGARNDGATSI